MEIKHWLIVYDIRDAKRLGKVEKIMASYAYRVQKSVFEGEITEKNLTRLKNELQRTIDYDEDQVTIYEFDSIRYAAKDIIGYHIMTDNII